jgi:hypothetical protein
VSYELYSYNGTLEENIEYYLVRMFLTFKQKSWDVSEYSRATKLYICTLVRAGLMELVYDTPAYWHGEYSVRLTGYGFSYAESLYHL